MSFDQNNQNNVKKLAYLARLAIDHSIVEDLSNILHLLDKISEINTDHIEPLQHTQEVSQRFRPDIVTEHDVRDLMQSEVAESSKAAGLYLVPKVVE